MKKHIFEFLRRGFVALGIGPIVLAILYLILRRHAGLESLSVDAVVIGIFSISALAFIAGGMNSIYQIERLPLMAAILIHGAVLYGSYLCTYLLNDWLDLGVVPILVFSGIFVFGFFAIWAVIYAVVHKNTKSLNEKLKQKQNVV
jgi:hypothetical protein